AGSACQRGGDHGSEPHGRHRDDSDARRTRPAHRARRLCGMTRAPYPATDDSRPYLRAAGLVTSATALLFVGWLFTTQPASVVEIPGGVAGPVGAYHVDAAQFEEGRELFVRESFEAARAAFERADPARLDPRTQFYVAYSYYREGWGRFSHDDA